MAGWFDHERDFVAEPHAPIRTPDYDDLSARSIAQIRGLVAVRRALLIGAAATFVAGGVLASLPLGLVQIVGGVLFVAGLAGTPLFVYLLRSARRELAGREQEAAAAPVTGRWAD